MAVLGDSLRSNAPCEIPTQTRPSEVEGDARYSFGGGFSGHFYLVEEKNVETPFKYRSSKADRSREI